MTVMTRAPDPGVPDLAGPLGLRVWFYRPAHGRDDTGGGLSGNHDQATITAVVAFVGDIPQRRPLPPVAQVMRPTPDAPALWLVRDTASGAAFLVPADRPVIDEAVDLARLSFGGNFAFSDTPAFARLTGTRAAIPVHDRNRP